MAIEDGWNKNVTSEKTNKWKKNNKYRIIYDLTKHWPIKDGERIKD